MARERPAGFPKLKKYEPTRFMLDTSHYDEAKADRAVTFIENLKHTKGKWDGKPFWLLPWQEQIIRDIFGVVKDDDTRQFRTAYVEIPKKNGKSELGAAIALNMLCNDDEWRRSTALQQTGSRRPSFSMWPDAWWKRHRRCISGPRSLPPPSGL